MAVRSSPDFPAARPSERFRPNLRNQRRRRPSQKDNPVKRGRRRWRRAQRNVSKHNGKGIKPPLDASEGFQPSTKPLHKPIAHAYTEDVQTASEPVVAPNEGKEPQEPLKHGQVTLHLPFWAIEAYHVEAKADMRPYTAFLRVVLLRHLENRGYRAPE